MVDSHGDRTIFREEADRKMIIDALSFIGEGIYKKQSVDQLLDEMDRCGVCRTYIAPVEEGITVHNQEANRRILTLIEQYPDRLGGYAAVNPWYRDQAATWLKEAFENGMSGVYFHSALQGFTISDELVYPLIDLCGEYHKPAYFHTGTPAYALPMQLHDLAEEFPDVQFIMGHCGANDFAGDALPSLFGRDNIWLETSLTLAVSQAALIREAPGRVIFGSAAPRSALAHELNKTRRACAGDEILEQKVLSGNIRSLFGGSQKTRKRG